MFGFKIGGSVYPQIQQVFKIVLVTDLLEQAAAVVSGFYFPTDSFTKL